MTIHEPTVYRKNNGENAWPTYEITWPQGEPQPGDKVLMSAELFQHSIEILSGWDHRPMATPQPGTCRSCPNRDPRMLPE